MKKRTFKLIYIPNALCIIFALFLLLFSFDVFGGTESIWEQIVGFLIHSIPSFLIIVIFLFSRKWPLVGAITGVVVFVFFTVFFNTYRDFIVFLLVSLPVLLIGTLYLIVYFERKKRKMNE